MIRTLLAASSSVASGVGASSRRIITPLISTSSSVSFSSSSAAGDVPSRTTSRLATTSSHPLGGRFVSVRPLSSSSKDGDKSPKEEDPFGLHFGTDDDHPAPPPTSAMPPPANGPAKSARKLPRTNWPSYDATMARGRTLSWNDGRPASTTQVLWTARKDRRRKNGAWPPASAGRNWPWVPSAVVPSLRPPPTMTAAALARKARV